METLEDLLSDSDYEGPASKLRLHSYASVHRAPEMASQHAIGVPTLEPILEPSEVLGSLGVNSTHTDGDDLDCFATDFGGDAGDQMDCEDFSVGRHFGNFSSYRFDCDTDSQRFPWESQSGIASNHNVAVSPGSDGLDEFMELEKQIEVLTERPLYSSKLSKWEWVSEGTPPNSNIESEEIRSNEVESGEVAELACHLRSSEESFEAELYNESALVPDMHKNLDENFPTAYSNVDESVADGLLASPPSETAAVCGNSCMGEKEHVHSNLDDCSNLRQMISSPLETSTACSSGVGEKSVGSTSEPTSTTSGSNALGSKKQFLKKGSRMPRSLIPPSSVGDSKSSKSKEMPKLKPRSSSMPAVSSRSTSQPFSDFQVEVRVPLGPPKSSANYGNQADGGSSPSFGGLDSYGDDVGSSSYSRKEIGGHDIYGDDEGSSRYSNKEIGGLDSYGDGVGSTSYRHKETGGLDSYGGGGSSSYRHKDIDDEWADTMPWDCRGTELDLEMELDETPPSSSKDPALLDEPPTSKVVQSYFRSSLTPRSGQQGKVMEGQSRRYSQQQGRWEGPEQRSSGLAQRPPSTPELCAPPEQHCNGTFEREENARLAALEAEIKKYEKENEQLKKIRAQVEQSERDIAREREKLYQEVDAEKQALHAEFDTEQAALKRERRRLTQNAERLRQQLSDDRDAADERKQLRERTEQLEEELREKEKRWTRTVDRLQRQVCDLTRKNQELEEEVRRAGLQMQQAQFGLGRSASATSARGRQPKAAPRARTPTQRGATGGVAHSSSEPWQAQNAALKPTDDNISKGRAGGGDSMAGDLGDFIGDRDGHTGAVGPRRPSKSGLERSASKLRQEAWASKQDSPVVREVKSGEGRTERFFEDGRREVEFGNGLKKVLFPDGRTRVMFQNGDEKEIRPDGVVVYHYFATKAVQTTLPDSCEIYQFQDGQFEKHHPDGSKEIHFPNGTMKRVQPDGSEEVTFADGTVRRSTSASHLLRSE